MVTIGSQVAIALDNTNAYREIEELNLGLEVKVRARTAALEQFLARVSHDLRTPLTSICGFADNMLDGLAGPLTDKQGQYLTRMLANGRRLGRLVDNLLDMLVDPDKMRLSLAEVDLSSLSSDVIEQLRPLALAKNQCLDVQFGQGTFAVWADADKLTRVLTNVVDNAIKYTPPHGSITVKIEAMDRFARVSVSDTGEGIPAEALPRIFDPGFSIDRENKMDVISHRLGLSIVKDLVERHGGSITVTSTVGKGSIFCFTIPLVRILKTKELRADGATIKQLLVADDDLDIREMLRDRLTAAGYTVITASDGKEALYLLQDREFHGIILDIGMPQMSGLDVLSKVHSEKPTIPIIIITAASSEERALLSLQAGAHAYLLKPFDPGRLIELIEQVAGTPR
jgi:CheY-like chemotaxis protein